MAKFKLHKELSYVEFYILHIHLLNAFAKEKLTPKAIEILAYFMSLKGDIAEERFNTLARKFVKQKFGIGNAGLSNYIREMKDKGFIYENDKGVLDIIPALKAKDSENMYMFSLKMIDNDKE
jgi:hypothetical protein